MAPEFRWVRLVRPPAAGPSIDDISFTQVGPRLPSGPKIHDCVPEELQRPSVGLDTVPVVVKHVHAFATLKVIRPRRSHLCDVDEPSDRIARPRRSTLGRINHSKRPGKDLVTI